jgi:hypothetical protein
MIMGGADLDSGVTVNPQALVLKAMKLEAGIHTGSPTQRIS